jgi:hypothetical protein
MFDGGTDQRPVEGDLAGRPREAVEIGRDLGEERGGARGIEPGFRGDRVDADEAASDEPESASDERERGRGRGPATRPTKPAKPDAVKKPEGGPVTDPAQVP